MACWIERYINVLLLLLILFYLFTSNRNLFNLIVKTRRDRMAECVERLFPVLVDRGIETHMFETPVESSQLLKN